jgi:tRNA dimethylallyltransferase
MVPRIIICLMGPTASGKTPLAVELVKRFPCDIISVDSAMVYRGMDIGTAKPDADVLKVAPHRLIDLIDPSEHYSAGQFRTDALREIENSLKHGRIPLLVGGTMMYFRALQQGMAALPPRDPALRLALQERGEREGWEALHRDLSIIDPEAGERIHPHDSQRIQRALEVFMLTGKTISATQAETNPLSDVDVLNIAIAPADRRVLHERIEKRFDVMLANGFVEEVRRLFERGDLTPDLPSIRSVGYRQVWEHLSGHLSFDEMREKAIIATRQLAKRQLTWLRAWPDLSWYDSESQDLLEAITLYLKLQVAAHQR